MQNERRDYRVSVSHAVSTLELRVDTDRIRHEIQRKATQQIAHALVNHPTLALKEYPRDYTTEFRLTVNILTDDELHTLIETRAMDIAHRYSFKSTLDTKI